MHSSRQALVFVLIMSMQIVSTKIELSNNGYTGILVSISENIPENEILLTKNQSWLTEASQKLYIASKYRFYLKQITIRIPESWSNDGKYKTTTSSTVQNADILIEDPKPTIGSNPFVRGVPGCGMQGEYMHFTTDVISGGNNGSFGHLGTVFVHEWGHLRWGLLDEYPTIRDKSGNTIRFYLNNGRWEPVRCTTQIKGRTFNRKTGGQCRLDSTGKPEPDCYFSPYTGATSTTDASIMGFAFIPSISQFCDKDPNSILGGHNELAPNNQNSRCNGRSSWEVIREHDDYKRSSQGSPFASTQPEFILEQLKISGKFCLVIDVSGSMASYIQDARNALETVIKNVLPNESYVGIVKFSSTATLLQDMTKIESEDARNDLASQLPSTTGGSTSIGAGLQKCTEVLAASGNASGSKIYLATDGQENAFPYIADVMPDLTREGIILDTLAIGPSADQKLKNISQTTGGSSYFYTTSSENSTALVDALIEPFVYASNDPIIRIQSLHVKISLNEVFTTQFVIDDSIGRNTVIQLTAKLLNNVNLTVNHTENIYTVIGAQQEQGVISIKIPGTAQVGQYNVRISSYLHSFTGTLTILSKAAKPGGDILQTKVLSTASDIKYQNTVHYPLFVSVFRGTAPVTEAVVTVLIENENGHSSSLHLKDNAIGADVTANDGIYSGYILATHITSNGRHSIKIITEGHDSSIIIPVTRSPGKDFSEETYEEQPIGSFMRVTLANEIVVTNYIQPVNDADDIPPSSILTLRLADSNAENNTFTLTWQAVGDDFDTGKASYYDIRYYTNLTALREDPNSQTNLTTSQDPNEPGEEETFIFKIPESESNTTYFLVVRAVDENGNIGNLSNFVSVSILTDKTWFAAENVKEENNEISIAYLIGIACGSSVIVIVALMWCISFFRQLKVPKKSQSPI